MTLIPAVTVKKKTHTMKVAMSTKYSLGDKEAHSDVMMNMANIDAAQDRRKQPQERCLVPNIRSNSEANVIGGLFS